VRVSKWPALTSDAGKRPGTQMNADKSRMNADD
jgi:hypothetical protein